MPGVETKELGELTAWHDIYIRLFQIFGKHSRSDWGRVHRPEVDLAVQPFSLDQIHYHYHYHNQLFFPPYSLSPLHIKGSSPL